MPAHLAPSHLSSPNPPSHKSPLHPQVQLLRGERYTLKDNADPYTWVVQGPGGETKSAPAACLCIPAPDSEAVAKACRWLTPGCPHASGPVLNSEAVGARAGETERQTPSSHSLQAGHRAADPEAETVYREEPSEGYCCRTLTAWPAGYQRMVREGTDGWACRVGGTPSLRLEGSSLS